MWPKLRFRLLYRSFYHRNNVGGFGMFRFF
jgi:hypothetical protein